MTSAIPLRNFKTCCCRLRDFAFGRSYESPKFLVATSCGRCRWLMTARFCTSQGFIDISTCCIRFLSTSYLAWSMANGHQAGKGNSLLYKT
ncbi:hypothetical protein PoB_001312800 [Plakobranchus ocellatus]|uniref:Uncharacterized protein n=1 Tax=Plakobranchus ocellatus TaxID=259542 RepID=A0AAV3YW56_9GAST|nr:hypothetical protein PoB_001312800 [Plakobranchus ocellatus]